MSREFDGSLIVKAGIGVILVGVMGTSLLYLKDVAQNPPMPVSVESPPPDFYIPPDIFSKQTTTTGKTCQEINNNVDTAWKALQELREKGYKKNEVLFCKSKLRCEERQAGNLPRQVFRGQKVCIP